jgi:hypothetical protein
MAVATGEKVKYAQTDVMHNMEGGPPRRLEVSLLAFRTGSFSGRWQNRSWNPVQHTLSDDLDQGLSSTERRQKCLKWKLQVTGPLNKICRVRLCP